MSACRKCGVELVVGGNWTASKVRQRHYMCRACWTALVTARGAANNAAGRCRSHPGRPVIPGQTTCQECVDRKADRQRQRKYGITPAERAAWLERQGWCCAVPGCKGEPTCIDHDHGHDSRDPAGHRGIVCDAHNKMQGNAEVAAGPSPHAQARSLRALAVYLERWISHSPTEAA